MRPLLALCLAALAAATLSGCASDDLPAATGSDVAPLEGEQFQGAPDQGVPAGVGTPQSHGQFQREDSTVETGSEAGQIPGFWARKTVLLTNDFGGADRGVVFVGTDSGLVTVQPGDDDGYRVEAVLEGRGLTEQDARDQLARLDIVHTDEMKPDGLHLTTMTEREPQTQVIPGFSINLASNAWADIVVYLPAGPAYELAADASSGDLTISGLRGPSFLADTSSGDVVLSGLNAGSLLASTSSGDLTLDEVQAERVELGVSSGDITGSALRVGTLLAESASGSITLDGVIDTLEADASSGDIDVDAFGSESGAYSLSASSGSITLRLLYGDGHAYRVTADASSGDVDVDLPNSTGSSDDDEDGDSHVEVENRDFEEAPIQTIVDLVTSSGDISVSA